MRAGGPDGVGVAAPLRRAVMLLSPGTERHRGE